MKQKFDWPSFGAFLLLVFIMMVILMILASGCCPKIVESTQTKITRDSSTSFAPDTVYLPAKESVLDFDLNIICDSLSKLKAESEHKIVQPIVFTSKKNKTTFSLTVPASGIATVKCKEDSLVMIIDSLKQVTRVNTNAETTITDVVFKCDSGFHTFCKWWFWCSLAIAAALIFIVVKTNIL